MPFYLQIERRYNMLFEKIKMYSQKQLIALADENRTVSYQELYQRLVFNQKILRENGFRKNDIVLLKVDNQFEFVFSFLSLLTIPCWVIPIPVDMTQKEYERILSITQGKVFEHSLYECMEEYEILDKELEFPDTEAGGIYHMTSGSTSAPKLCVRTIHSLSVEGAAFQKLYSVGKNERILSAAPLYHSYALGAALMASMISGSTLYIINRFIPRQLLRIIDTKKITILLMVPVMAKALANTNSKIAYSMKTVRIALVGSGLVTREMTDKIMKKYGVQLYANYGSTETGGIISRITDEPVGSVGKPMEGVLVKIYDEEKKEVAPGETGQLWIKSPYMMKYYLYQQENNFDEQGYYCSGDLAKKDQDDFIYIVGRIKQLINVGGKKVNPREVEDVIMEYPGVEDCAVMGVRKSDGGESVKSLIVGKGIKNTDIYKHCLEKLSRYKCPVLIEFVDKIPRNNMGKIVKKNV